LIDLVLILKKSLWSIEAKKKKKKESMEKAESRMLFNVDKSKHDLLVNEASKLETIISTIEENSLSLWSDEESGQ
jgi:hypothetical protein